MRVLDHALMNDITQLISEGKTYPEIAKLDGMPSVLGLKSLVHGNPEFKRQLELVKSLRDQLKAALIPPHELRVRGYNPVVGVEIAERVARGGSIKEISKLPGYPHHRTIRHWISHEEEFSRIIWDARREAAQTMADEIVSISDDRTMDPGERRVMVDARKWVAAKLLPEYNDRVTVSGDAKNPVLALLAHVDGGTLGPPSKRGKVVEAEVVTDGS